MKQDISYDKSRLLVGILGGMGPLASAEFISSIHKFDLLNSNKFTEQDFSKYILLCDSSIPDRTYNLLNNKQDFLQAEVEKRLEILWNAKVDYIVPVCFTVSAVLHILSRKFKIVSMVGMAMKEILIKKQKVLILCTQGTRALNVFMNHPLWGEAKQYMVWLDDLDQYKIHELIYQIKATHDTRDLEQLIDMLQAKYNTSLWMAGCTELHLLGSLKYFKQKTFNFIDPFLTMAQVIAANDSKFLQDPYMVL
ncbi:MAG: aspartate racemase [Burkholderiales bacterium]|jgi:aspartate racemase|nr:aspartate racemase [Burkholderiales bacterium]